MDYRVQKITKLGTGRDTRPSRSGFVPDKTRVTLHVGMHFSAGAYFPDSIAANEALLATHDIHVPTPHHARETVTEMLTRLDGLPPIAAEEAEVLDTLLETSSARHLFLYDDRWPSPLRKAFSGDHLYHDIGARLGPLAELFASSDLQLSLSLVNPAVFLHKSLTSRISPKRPQAFVSRIDPKSLRWRDTVKALRRAVPEVPLLIWAEEDAPLIWPEVMRRVFGLRPEAPVEGRLLPLKPLLKDEGFERLLAYLSSHPPDTRAQYERVILVFLDKYGREEMLAPRCDIPGWDAKAIATVTAHYEEDVAAFANEDGITVLSPVTE